MLYRARRYQFEFDQAIDTDDLINMVRSKGLEPSRPYGHSHLKAARLPIPPTPHVSIIFLLFWYLLRF